MKENSELKTIQATLSRQGVEHQCLSAEELKQRFPNVLLARGEVGVLDKSGGVLYADKALRALQVVCAAFGATQPLRWFQPAVSQSPWPDEGLCPAGFILDLLGRAVLYALLGPVFMGQGVWSRSPLFRPK